MSVESATKGKDVFCDTSVLIDYVLDQGNTGARELLIESAQEKIISEKVEEEFEKVPDRKDEIYYDFLDIITSEEEDIAEQKADERDYLKKNDIGFFNSLRSDISEGESTRDKMRILRETQKIADRRYGRVEEIVGEPHPQNDDLDLIFKLGSVINNEDDCQVICDAVDWSINGGSGNFATLDKHDLINNREDINQAIKSKKDHSAILRIEPPDEYVTS